MVDYCIHLLYVHAAELALLFPFFGITNITYMLTVLLEIRS
jgi:hypothetical protein